MFKKENSGTDEYELNWNHGFNYGNIKPKVELLIKKKKQKFKHIAPFQCKSKGARNTIYYYYYFFFYC